MNLDLWLSQLETMQFVRRLYDPASSYLFKHVLVQETTYTSLLFKERMQLHVIVAETLEQTFPGQLDELAMELARHYDLAGQPIKAIPFYVTSGEQAMRVSAYPEAIYAYQRALELSTAGSGSERANLLVRLGEVHNRHSDFASAKEDFAAALVLAREQNEAAIAANALCGLAHIAGREGAHADSQRLAQEGLEWAQQAHELGPTAQALRLLGVVHNHQGNNDEAVRDLQTALGLYYELNDLQGITTCLNSLGVVATDQRDFEAAATFFQQALEMSQQLGDRHGMGIRLVNLGVIAQEQGDYVAAARYQEQALAIAREIGDREGIAHANLNLGGVLVKQDDLTGAIQYYRAALSESIDLGLFALALYVVAAVAEVRVKRRDYQTGARLLGFTFTHPAGTADIKADFESVLANLQAALSADELEAAMHRGESLAWQDVTSEILTDSMAD